jgi:hypothetical protein
MKFTELQKQQILGGASMQFKNDVFNICLGEALDTDVLRAIYEAYDKVAVAVFEEGYNYAYPLAYQAGEDDVVRSINRLFGSPNANV